MKTKSLIKIGVSLVLIAVVSVLALCGFQIGKYKLMPVSDALAQDMAMGGGASMTYKVEGDAAQVEETLAILETRLDTLYPEVPFSRVGSDMIRVETSDMVVAPYLMNLMTTVGHIDLTDEEGNVLATGADIDSVDFNQSSSGFYYLTLNLNESVQAAYAEYTASHVGGVIYLNLDGMTSIYFTIYSGIMDGVQPIYFYDATTYEDSYAQAAEIYTQLTLGELPVVASAVAVGEVTAVAGISAAEKTGMWALIALAAAAVVMIACYRVRGVAAAIALVVFTLVALYAQAIFGLVLSVSSFAGLFIGLVAAAAMLSASITAIKEETAAGRTGVSAVQFGMKAARMFSVDVFAVLAIVALFVMYFGSAEALHFGQTMLLGSVSALVSNWVLGFFLRNFARIASDRAAA